MKIKTIFVGKLQDRYLKEGIDIYLERISRYSRIELIEVADESVTFKSDPQKIKRDEAERILKRVPAGSVLVALDEKGEELSSAGLSRFLERTMVGGVREIVFAAGGSTGLGQEVMKRADLVLSLSRMTFTHQMVRLIILEQLYRAFTILKGEPYHK